MTYMTRQQQAVLDCIAACPGGCATAMALADRLRSGGQSVGLTTVYRQLERLEKQGLVHKLVTRGPAGSTATVTPTGTASC